VVGALGSTAEFDGTYLTNDFVIWARRQSGPPAPYGLHQRQDRRRPVPSPWDEPRRACSLGSAVRSRSLMNAASSIAPRALTGSGEATV
jgi:hypothetical protein